VSRPQEELTAEIHRTTFEDRLDRVRTNLDLVFSDLGAMRQLQAEQGVLAGQVLPRLESTMRVFRGELQTIHDLLYRTQILPDEEALESLLANLAICLQGVIDLQSSSRTSNNDPCRWMRGCTPLAISPTKSAENAATELCARHENSGWIRFSNSPARSRNLNKTGCAFYDSCVTGPHSSGAHM
jgi:hypothetical protein